MVKDASELSCMNLVPADHVCPVRDAFVDGFLGFALVAGLDCMLYRSDGAAG
jgi:hypothetical protein